MERMEGRWDGSSEGREKGGRREREEVRKVRKESTDYTIYDSLISFKCFHTNYL